MCAGKELRRNQCTRERNIHPGFSDTFLFINNVFKRRLLDSYWLRHYEVCLQKSSKTAARHGLLSVCIHPWLVDVDHLFDKLKKEALFKALPFVSLRLTTVPNCESRAVNTRREIKFYHCWLADNFFLMMQIHKRSLVCSFFSLPFSAKNYNQLLYFLFCWHYLKTLTPKRKNRKSQNSPPSTVGVWVTARLWDTTGRDINKLCTWENLKFKSPNISQKCSC